MEKKIYTYVIVGGGSAGCVLTNRLSKNVNNKILLLEAGLSDIKQWDSWKVKMPAALTYNLSNKRYNWGYHTEPCRNLKFRRLHWPRGKCLGGSSSLNAMVYIRGNAKDYDGWENKGAKNWSYRFCLPYFKKSTRHQLGENTYRGGTGPLTVSRGQNENPLFNAFIEAGQESDYPFTNDLNGFQQEGLGPMDMTIDWKSGIRSNASKVYLTPCKTRENVKIITSSLVRKIIWEKHTSSKPRAIGVEVQNYNEIKYFYAENEIILAAGAINSPQILMLSGIGFAEELERIGVSPVINNKNVGCNLQDHIECYVQYACKQPITINPYGTWNPPWKRTGAGIQWFIKGDGVCASNQIESGGFIRSSPGVEYPNIQWHFFPGLLTGQLDFGKFHGFQIHAGTMRDRSRGSLHLQSLDPFDVLKIRHPYFSWQEDLEGMLAAVRLTVELCEQRSFSPFRGARQNLTDEILKSDKKLINFLSKHCESSYHPSCTLAIGKVLDSEFRVKGVEGLRVIDASSMPSIVTGNLNGPTIMLAEKGADLILKNKMLEPIKIPVYQNNNWRIIQR